MSDEEMRFIAAVEWYLATLPYALGAFFLLLLGAFVFQSIEVMQRLS